MQTLIIILGIIGSFILIPLATIKRPSLGLAVLIACLPLLNLGRRLYFFSAPPFPTFETWAIILFFIVTQFYSFALHKRFIFFRRKDLFIILFLIPAYISTYFYANDPETGLEIFVAGAVAPILCYMVAAWYIREQRDVQYIAYAYFFLVLLATVITLIYFDRRQSIFIGVSEDQFAEYLYSSSNAVVLFLTPSATISALVGAIPISIWYKNFGKWKPGLVWATTTVLTLINALLSLSRGSWLSVCIAFLLGTLLLKGGKQSKYSFILGTSFFVLLFVVGLTQWDFIASLLSYKFYDAPETTSIRWENYQLALLSIREFTFTGLGLGNYSQVYSRFPYMAASNMEPLSFAHNLFLTLIPEIGGLGAIAFLAIFVANLVRALMLYKRLTSPSFRSLVMAMFISVIAYMVLASTSGTYLVASIGYPFFIAPALVVNLTLLGALSSLSKAREATRDSSLPMVNSRCSYRTNVGMDYRSDVTSHVFGSNIE